MSDITSPHAELCRSGFRISEILSLVSKVPYFGSSEAGQPLLVQAYEVRARMNECMVAILHWRPIEELRRAVEKVESKANEHMNQLIALIEFGRLCFRLSEIRRLVHKFPYIGSWEASQPLAEEARQLREKMDDCLVAIMRGHPMMEVRRAVAKADSNANDQLEQIIGLTGCRPRHPYTQREEDFPELAERRKA
jgi:hypothetical protein